MRDIICIVGLSGSGKSTIEKELVTAGLFEKLISTTTRKIRDGEKDGYDYHFITEEKHKEHEVAGDFFETKHHFDTYYGVLKEEMDKSKKMPCIFVTSYPGFVDMKKKFPNNVKMAYIKVDEEARVEKVRERGVPGIMSRISEEKRNVVLSEIEENADMIFKNDYSSMALEDIVMTIVGTQYSIHLGRGHNPDVVKKTLEEFEKGDD